MDELTLPSFELDCRDWLVADPAETGLPEEVAGAPVVAVLSTAVIDRERLYSVGAVLSLGLLDEDSQSATEIGVRQLDDAGSDEGLVRYVVPAPGSQLGLLAEFTVDDFSGPELRGRIEALMASFRWAS
jgi:hypothetical protein